MSKRVLVTGASGFIAQQLILDLLEQGHSVRGTVRSLAKGGALREALGQHTRRAGEIELVEADLDADEGWADAVAGVDVIHHLASPFPMAAPKNPDDLIRPAREGALRVLRAAKKAGVDRVVLTSSCAAIAYGCDRLPETFTEADWTNPDNTSDCTAYVQSKVIAERAAWDYVNREGKGIALTSINPVAVFGPIRSNQVKTSVGIVAQLMAGKYPALPNAGIQVVDVRDVSAAHQKAMDDPATIGERYIVADQFYWLKDFARVLRDAYPDRASKIPTRGLPDFVVRLLARFSGDMKTIAKELGKRRFSSSEKVRKLLGRNLIPGDEAIRASAETLIRYGAV
jgi:nucleoside-diphosphate-sugar epimerase